MSVASTRCVSREVMNGTNGVTKATSASPALHDPWSTHPDNPFNDPDDRGNFGEYNPHPQSHTDTPAQKARLSPSDGPLPMGPAGSGPFTPFPPPPQRRRPSGPRDTHRLLSSLSTSPIQPSHSWAAEDAGGIFVDTPEVQDADRCVTGCSLFPCRDIYSSSSECVAQRPSGVYRSVPFAASMVHCKVKCRF